MSARSVVKTSFMSAGMQEYAIIAAQDAIANFTTEQEIASSIKSKFEQQFPSTWVEFENWTDLFYKYIIPFVLLTRYSNNGCDWSQLHALHTHVLIHSYHLYAMHYSNQMISSSKQLNCSSKLFPWMLILSWLSWNVNDELSSLKIFPLPYFHHYFNIAMQFSDATNSRTTYWLNFRPSHLSLSTYFTNFRPVYSFI